MGVTIPEFIDALKRFPTLGPKAVMKAKDEIEIISIGTMRRAMTDSKSPDGTPYQPLKYQRVRGGTKPLLDTGLLRASLSASVTEDELVLQGIRPGARVHQFGAVIRPVHAKKLSFLVGVGRGRKRTAQRVFADEVTIPARPYLGLTPEAVQRISYAISLAVGQLLLEEGKS